MLLVAGALSVPSLLPQIEGGDYQLTPGAAFAWEHLSDLGAPISEDPRFLVDGGATWLTLATVHGPAGVKHVAARAVERATGTLLWSRASLFEPAPGDLGEETLAAVDATANGATAFLLGMRDDVAHVAAIDVATGAVAWDVALGSASLGTLTHIGAIAASPNGAFVAVAGTSSISPYDATVVTLSGSDGSQLWSLHGAAFGNPQSMFDRAELTASTLFVSLPDFSVSPSERTLFARDAASGAALWQAQIDGNGFSPLFANPSGTRVAAAASKVSFSDPFTSFVEWYAVHAWDAASGAETLVASQASTAILGLAFDGDGDLITATVPSDPWGSPCAEVSVASHDLALLNTSWSTVIAPGFGTCETAAAALLVTPAAALVGVQSANAEPGGRVEVHAFALSSGAVLWSAPLAPASDKGDKPLAQLAGDASSIGITTREPFSVGDLGGTRLSTLAAGDGALAWTRLDTESGPSFNMTLDIALAPNGATLFALENVDTYGAKLRALSAATGATLWSTALEIDLLATSVSAFRGDLAVSPAGDVVYAHLRQLEGAGAVGRLIAMDTGSGAELWQVDLADIDSSGHLRRSLALDAAGARLFTAAGDHAARVQATSADNGALLWDAPIPFPSSGGLPFEGMRDLEHSGATGMVYALASFLENGSASDPDVFVAALDAATGAVVWTRHLDPTVESAFSEAASLSVDPTGDRVVIAFEDDLFTHVQPDASRLVALDAHTGANRWSQALPGAGELEHAREVAHALGGARAVVAGSKAIGDPDFRVVAAAFDAAGTKVWETAVPTAGPVEVNRVLTSADGTAVAVVASLPASSFGVGSFDEQGFAVLWLDAVNGSVLWNATLTTPTDGYAVRTQLLDALLDEQALYVGGLYYNFPEGEPVTCDSYVARFALPRLTTPASELSVTLGGAVPLALRPGADKAGHLYLVLGSITGTEPGIPIAPGVVLPLVFDAWTNLTLVHAGKPSLLPGTIGVLDSFGRASAAYLGQGSGATALIGLELFHAFATMHPGTGVIGPASNPVATTFVP